MKNLKTIMTCMVLCIIMNASLCSCGKTEQKQDFTMWKPDGTITEVISYVEDITNENGENYIPPEDRIAVFDLDGTLVGEQFPIYFEWLMFAQRVLADPDFEPDQEMIEVAEAVLAAGESRHIPEDLEEKESLLFGKAFEGMTTDEYRAYVNDFLSQNADGFDNLTFGDAYFKPMTEIIAYLEKNEFRVFICSGTDRDADRMFVKRFSDVPFYQIIGSDFYTEGANHPGVYYLEYHIDPDEALVRDDGRIIKNVKSSKAVQMAQEIGQKPVLAFGNSTGDTSMFIYTTYGNPYKSAAFCIVPDDDEREYAYPEKVEKLAGICQENGWYTISMKDDFLTIYGDNVMKNENNTAFIDSVKEAASEKKAQMPEQNEEITIRHISFGNGEKTMVVVPGLSIGYVTDSAEAIESAFSAFTDDYTVYLFDIRDDVPENYTIKDMGEDLAHEIMKLGLSDIYLYGCSMGGMESIYIAGTYPELVEKAAIVSSACQANENSESVIGNWIQLAKEGKCHELTDSMGQLIYSPAVYEASKDAFAAMADGLTPELLTRFVNTAGVITGMDLTKEAAAIQCPVLVIGSEGDQVLSAEASKQIAEITGGELYMYGEESAHAVYDEAPDLRERVKAFFD